tara:strand:- start:146 stop:304 length:159 start_codon:yes stop_codon:yes gene_type:complete
MNTIEKQMSKQILKLNRLLKEANNTIKKQQQDIARLTKSGENRGQWVELDND